MLIHSIALFCALAPASSAQAPKPTSAPIRIHDAIAGCFHRDDRKYEWKSDGTGYTAEWGKLSSAELDKIRATILEAPPDRPDLLDRIGFTRASLAANRQTILEAAWPDSMPRTKPLELPSGSTHLLDFDRIAPFVRSELLGQNWFSTSGHEVEIEIAGDPAIRIRSTGQVPYMLPWEIEAGGKRWDSNDVEISRAVLVLLDPKGPNRAHVDGAAYWRDAFWRSGDFWDRFVGREIDTDLSSAAYAALPGYSAAMDLFRIDKTQTGSINSQPESLFVQMTARHPSTIDGAWWWSPLSEGKPSVDWNEFLRLHAAASRAVEGQKWLLEWKASGPDRTIDMHAAGRVAYSETMIASFVLPPWKHAGLAGAPEFEILLRRKGEWCGTVWLSSADPAAMIETAKPGVRTHWFDALDFSFHPTQPEYGVVDGAGVFRSRRIPK